MNSTAGQNHICLEKGRLFHVEFLDVLSLIHTYTYKISSKGKIGKKKKETIEQYGCPKSR